MSLDRYKATWDSDGVDFNAQALFNDNEFDSSKKYVKFPKIDAHSRPLTKRSVSTESPGRQMPA